MEEDLRIPSVGHVGCLACGKVWLYSVSSVYSSPCPRCGDSVYDRWRLIYWDLVREGKCLLPPWWQPVPDPDKPREEVAPMPYVRPTGGLTGEIF